MDCYALNKTGKMLLNFEIERHELRNIWNSYDNKFKYSILSLKEEYSKIIDYCMINFDSIKKKEFVNIRRNKFAVIKVSSMGYFYLSPLIYIDKEKYNLDKDFNFIDLNKEYYEYGGIFEDVFIAPAFVVNFNNIEVYGHPLYNKKFKHLTFELNKFFTDTMRMTNYFRELNYKMSEILKEFGLE